MNARKEMERTMKTFGEPLIINPISGKEEFNGSGLFQKIETKQNSNVEDDGIFEVSTIEKPNKFKLWLFDFKKERKITRIKCSGKFYRVISSYYEKDFCCWRMIVEEERKK